MKRYIKIILRDLFLFALLLTLVCIAFNRSYHFLLAYEKSLIHELDGTFLDQMCLAQKQTHYSAKLLEDGDKQEALKRVNDIKQRLATIEQQYKKNSPGLIFLGPIATTSIVLKEKKLAAKLLATINELELILAKLDGQQSIELAPSIDKGLAANKKRIKNLYYISS